MAFLREITVTAADRKIYGDRQGDFLLHRNLLYRKCTIPLTTEKALLIVVPATKRQMALDACHRESGHHGRDCTLRMFLVAEDCNSSRHDDEPLWKMYSV